MAHNATYGNRPSVGEKRNPLVALVIGALKLKNLRRSEVVSVIWWKKTLVTVIVLGKSSGCGSRGISCVRVRTPAFYIRMGFPIILGLHSRNVSGVSNKLSKLAILKV